MKIRWIFPLLGTAPYSVIADTGDEFKVVDVRDLVDKAGNDSRAILKKIQQGVTALRQGRRTLVCCDYGRSRSNAVAAGILSVFENTDFEEALHRVQQTTGETEIKLEPIMAVRKALGASAPGKRTDGRPSILVTGGGGFLGKAICSVLQDHYCVVAPERTELDLLQGSTRFKLLADRENVISIVHLANPRIYTSNEAMGQTLTMLRNAIDVCVDKDITLIYPSNWEIYSGYAAHLCADEATPALPKGPYGETKYLAEVLIEHFSRTAELKCALLRFSSVYGPGVDRPKFLHNFAGKAFASEPIVTHQYRNGDPALDLLHIDDMARAVLAVLDSDFTGTLNLGAGEVTTTRQIAKMIKTALHSKSTVSQIPIHDDVASIAMNCRKAKQAIGWKSTVPLERGLRELLEYMKNKRSAPNEPT